MPAPFRAGIFIRQFNQVRLNIPPSAYLSARTHRDEFAVAVGDACGDGLALFDEGDRVGVFGNAVEPCAVFRGEGFE